MGYTPPRCHSLLQKDRNKLYLPEIKLQDARGQSAGNIDYVIVKYDDKGNITDFASIEVQGVYISGNLRKPFDKYMENQNPHTLLVGV